MSKTFLSDMIRQMGKPTPKVAAPAAAAAVLDSTATAAAAAAEVVVDPNAAAAVLDAVDDKAPAAGADYAGQNLALNAVAAVQEWAETAPSDLDEGENLATRLFALMAGIADENMDGEISDDEAAIVDAACDAAWQYMSAKGATDDDLSAIFNDMDAEAASRVQELIAGSLPDGDQAAAEDMDEFVFGDGSDESVMDAATLDAVYKKRFVVRGGKKQRINKRVSGTVRLSSKQKVAVRKMLRKSHSAAATMHRMKSMRVVRRMAT